MSVESETIHSLLLLLEHGNIIFPDIIVLRTTETIQKWSASFPLTAKEKQTYRNIWSWDKFVNESER